MSDSNYDDKEILIIIYTIIILTIPTIVCHFWYHYTQK